MDDRFFTRWILQNPVLATDPERAQRAREVENALLMLHFDGCAVPPSVQWQLARYVRGELRREEAFAEVYGLGVAKSEAALWEKNVSPDPKTGSQWPG